MPTIKTKLLEDILSSLQNQISDRIGGVVVSMVASSAVDRGFEPRSGQTKDYKIGICCFSAKNTALRRKSKDWLARNQNNLSEWSDMSTLGLLFQWVALWKSNSACWSRTKRTLSSSSHKTTLNENIDQLNNKFDEAGSRRKILNSTQGVSLL